MMNPSYRQVEQLLVGRWPETRLDPTLDRIRALCELMGDPQRAFAVVHLTGTNGKTSTSRMIDNLLRALDLRTGRFTSPHLQSMTERISIDGEPLSEELFVEAFADVAPFADLVDQRQQEDGDPPLSFFEMMVAMAYAAFADAPVDVGIVEVGMGGVWDATNIADAAVAVVTPIGIDHVQYLGSDLSTIATEKAGIIKPGSQAIMATSEPAVTDVLMGRALEVGAVPFREGIDFAVTSVATAVGGQLISVQGLAGRYEDIFLPLHGAHQARNASYAIAAVEAFNGGREIGAEVVQQALATVTSPGRLEVVRRGPTVLLDAAHNPHAMTQLVESLGEAFALSPLIAVVAVMSDKDVVRMLEVLEPVAAHIVVTRNSQARSMQINELAEVAGDVFGQDRVTVSARLDDALERAIALAETAEGFSDEVGAGGVLVTGSVVTVGEARTLLATAGSLEQ